jgi:drug/metabolite transporter (DMT)-like permease
MTTFAAATLLGGGNFLAVRFSNRELPPTWGAALRFTVAAAIFVGIALAMRLPWPRGRELWRTVQYGLLSIGIFYALMYWALVRVTAGVATVVLAIVPLLTLLLAAVHGMERLARRSIVGGVLALAGIAWMTLGPGTIVVTLPALAALLAGALCISESVILGKKLSMNHPVITNAVAIPSGAAMLLALSAATGDPWTIPATAEARWAVLYLVTAGSVGLFILILMVVRVWTASATAYMFVLFPLVTMLLGAVVGDETITLQAVSGALIVIAGVWFGALSPAVR